MASDPTDLIREADEHHHACCPDVTEDCECLRCGQEWPCEVRRLRDALEASEAKVPTKICGWDCDWPDCSHTVEDGPLWRMNPKGRRGVFMCSDHATDQRIIDERSKALAALAEANATVDKVRKIVDDPTLKDYAALAAIRRAIEGPAT